MSKDSRDSAKQNIAHIKSKLVAGLMGFYLLNLTGFLIGLIAIESLGNLEGIIVMLTTIYSLNAFVIAFKYLR